MVAWFTPAAYVCFVRPPLKSVPNLIIRWNALRELPPS